MLSKINFKHPKYIFPPIIATALAFVVYNVSSLFGSSSQPEPEVPTDEIIADLPDPNLGKSKGKLESMLGRFGKDNSSMSAIEEIGKEYDVKEDIDELYTSEELERLMAEQEAKQSREDQIASLEAQMAGASRQLDSNQSPNPNANPYVQTNPGESYGAGNYGGSYSTGGGMSSQAQDMDRELAEIQERAYQRQLQYQRNLDPEYQERMKREQAEKERLAREEEEKRLNAPALVEKAEPEFKSAFNTIDAVNDHPDALLIKAMIDQTTKARDGSRIRFKLLDDVTVKGVDIPKGSYLYGNVTGFTQQRVKVNITSILRGNQFIKVNLSVFDNDGMEGFYVPQSDFRDFVKNAGSSVAGTSINMNTGYGSVGENAALQALQNIYSAAGNAISGNFRKNKATIKYNTIVYLINIQEYDNN